MIQFKNIKLYSQQVKSIRFPQKRDEPFMLLYFSENSNLLEDLLKLNLKRVDIRHAIIPLTTIPRTRLMPDTKKLYKQLGLFAYSSNMRFPPDKNIFFDFSQYLSSIDDVYKVTNYRQRAGFLIKNMILKSYLSFMPSYQKVFFYSIDITKEFNPFINRKIFPILQQIKTGNFPFDHFILCLITESGPRYRVLIKDKEYNFPRVLQYIKNIKTISTEEEIEADINTSTNLVIDKIKKEVSPKNMTKIKGLIQNYLKKDKVVTDKIINKEIGEKEDLEQVVITSVLYGLNGDLSNAKRLSKAIPPDKRKVALKNIDKQYIDELLQPQPTVSLSNEVIIQQSNVPKMVDEKSPEHIFQKRQIDFEINLKKDIENSFRVLEKRQIPIKLEKVEIVDKPQKPNEIEKSDVAIVKVSLKDKFDNKHQVEFEIPKIDSKSGTFRVNGKKKCLINQIVLCPITFPKPYDSKFESSYSSFHIWSKKLKRVQYLEVYMGSYKVPLLILLAFSFGFEKTLKQYEISHSITETKPSKDSTFSKIDDTRYIVFSNLDTDAKKEMAMSLIQAKISGYSIQEEFGTKEYFNKLIIEMTGRINSTFLITSNIENIVDPVVEQVLINQQLPSDLPIIIEYMVSKVVTGFRQPRNDLSNQRIRNSEIIVHLAQKQILASYTEYKEQVLSGNIDAKFTMLPTKVMSEFINSEIVVDMEYANPIEEMATMTRVSPVGKAIGGIPDKGAMTMEGRDVHDSYFGIIDPTDTPEGPNIGIIQQLTVDSLITSARGLFHQKDISNTEYSGMLSTSAVMVPFIGNNDPTRVMFACSQAKQALPLKKTEPPAVRTGYESILTNVLSDTYIKRAPCDGKVSKITRDNIEVICNNGKKTIIDITPAHLKSGSGKNTLGLFKTKVKEGQSIKQNEVLAEGSCVEDGNISLGATFSVAYFPYRGYNFEDGIVINERLVSDDRLTSIHGIVEEVLLEKDDRLIEIVEMGTFVEKGQPLLRKTIGEIEKILGYDESEEDDTVDLISRQFIKKSPGGTIVDIEVYSNVKETVFPQLKTLIDRTNKKQGRTKGNLTVRGQSIKGVLIRFKIEQELKIKVGDKLANRHGNKGIISLIEKDENMPRTPWGDKLDVILNPLGIIGRMNMGQLFELYCGLISKELAKLSMDLNKQGVVKLFKSVLPILDTSPNKKFSNTFIKNLSNLSPKKFLEMQDQIKKSSFVPLIIPPFKAPSYKEVGSALKVLGLKTAYPLYLPEYNTRTKNPVSVGYMYLMKLEHIGEMKVHARSTGPVTGKFLQPTAGKRREGGQRMGEGDTWSLLSYNCPTVLDEFFGPLSDDHATKNEIIADIIQTGEAVYREAKTQPTKDLLNAYFIAMMLGK